VRLLAIAVAVCAGYRVWIPTRGTAAPRNNRNARSVLFGKGAGADAEDQARGWFHTRGTTDMHVSPDTDAPPRPLGS